MYEKNKPTCCKIVFEQAISFRNFHLTKKQQHEYRFICFKPKEFFAGHHYF